VNKLGTKKIGFYMSYYKHLILLFATFTSAMTNTAAEIEEIKKNISSMTGDTMVSLLLLGVNI